MAHPNVVPTENRRNGWLDIVRALAIILVVNCHIASSQNHEGSAQRWIEVIGLGGHGVDLFFVLSGWLLGSILLREVKQTGTIDIRRFWKRRWLRTLPAYYAVLTATLCQAAWQGKFEAKQLSYFLFLQGYLFDFSPFFGVSWSLCVEEHFYLMIAPAILLTRGITSRSLIILSLFLFIPTTLRSMGLFNSDAQTHVRVDQCAAGVMLAYIHLHLPRTWNLLKKCLPYLAVIAIFLVGFSILQRLGIRAGNESLFTFTFTSLVLVAFADYSEWCRSIRIPGVRYIATRSYAVYLLHIEAIAAVKYLGIVNLWIRGLLIWSLSFLCAELLFRLIEQPFMTLREHKGTQNNN